MHEIDIAQLDLNLLVVLEVLLEERNVTRAARRLGRTQSATSHALGRLRVQLEDPLLVRVGGEMRPTPRAEQLAPELSRLLRALGRVLGEAPPFDPATSDRVYLLGGPDFLAAALPTLVARMARETPHASVELIPPSRTLFSDVAEGRLDLAIAPPRGTRAEVEGLRSAPLTTLDWAVFMRADHPARARWDARTWAAYPHLRVRTAGPAEGPVERAAQRRRVRRRLGPTLPHFWLAPALLAQTDLLFTAPRAVLADVAARYGLVAEPCPISIEPVALALHWGARFDAEPGLVYFRATVQEVLREVFAETGLRRRAMSAPFVRVP